MPSNSASAKAWRWLPGAPSVITQQSPRGFNIGAMPAALFPRTVQFVPLAWVLFACDRPYT